MPIVLTTDVEWASESDIERLFDLADRYALPLFPFVTHDSPFLRRRGGAQGIHPNFLEQSTHGRTEAEVLDHCFNLVPSAKAFRSHCLYDHTRLVWRMAERGILIDSNVLRHLDDPRPYQTIGGYPRYPIYWADDVALRNSEHFDARKFARHDTLVCVVHPKNANEVVVRKLFQFACGRSIPFEDLYA